MFSFLFRHIFALLPVQESPIHPRRFAVVPPLHESHAQNGASAALLSARWCNTLEALVYVAPDQEPLLPYLERTFQLRCQEHESSMRYGGGSYSAGRNPVTHVHVTVVATGWLGWQIPKHYRNAQWQYVSLTYLDTYADVALLGSYQAIDASRYHIG